MEIRVARLNNCELEVITMENKLENLQKEVGGLIEIPYISERLDNAKVDIVINEEGKILELPATIALIDKNTGTMVDMVCGVCLFVSHDAEGNTIGLTDEQIEFVGNIFEKEIMVDSKNYTKVAVIKEDYL